MKCLIGGCLVVLTRLIPGVIQTLSCKILQIYFPASDKFYGQLITFANCLDLDQAQPFVGPDRGPDYLTLRPSETCF